MELQPYLFFDGRCEEAIEFYRRVLGAEVMMLMRFKEAPDQSMISPGSAEKVMHGTIRIGKTTVLVSDGRNEGKPRFEGFSLVIRPSSDAEAEQLFSNWEKAAR
jgi:PhnB protein